MCELPTPKTVNEVRSCLGFANYCPFIYKYAKVAWPLYCLISGENTSKQNKDIVWDGECKEAFRKLKEICTSVPILAYANFSKPFKLHTEACIQGLGVILYQSQDGVDPIKGHAHWLLSKTDHKYLAHKEEFLTLKWAITEQFHGYLYVTSWMQQVIIGLLVWKIRILPCAIDKKGWMWMEMLSPTFQGGSMVSILKLTLSMP